VHQKKLAYFLLAISYNMIFEYGITKGLYIVQNLPYIWSSMVGMHVKFVGEGYGCKDMVWFVEVRSDNT